MKPSIILGIETATALCGAAIADDDGLGGDAHVRTGLSHSSKLVDLVRRVLADTSVDLSQIDAIAVSIGPGSFTGIRIGMGTTLGLAAGMGKPVVGVPTLDALAWSQKPFRGLLCPFIDARRGEVYYCLYEATGQEIMRVGDYVVRPPEAMVEEVARAVGAKSYEMGALLAGPADVLGSSGAYGRAAQLGGIAVAHPERAHPGPGAVACLGHELYRKGLCVAPEVLKPIYVRCSDAELKRRGRDGKAGGKVGGMDRGQKAAETRRG